MGEGFDFVLALGFLVIAFISRTKQSRETGDPISFKVFLSSKYRALGNVAEEVKAEGKDALLDYVRETAVKAWENVCSRAVQPSFMAKALVNLVGQ